MALNKRPFKKRSVVGPVIFVGLMLAFFFYRVNLAENLIKENRSLLQTELNSYGIAVTQTVSRRLALVEGLTAFLEGKMLYAEEISAQEIEHYSAALYQQVDGILDIAIAPDNVMQYVYPFEVNQGVIGYNPAEDPRPEVRADVERAIATGDVVLSLPIELIQGGTGLIARQAVYGDGVYWGLANVVMELNFLVSESGLELGNPSIDLALLGQNGELFWGNPTVVLKDPVVYQVSLPEGSWQLLGTPKTSWEAQIEPTMRFYDFVGIIGVLLVSFTIQRSVNMQTNLKALVKQRTLELSELNEMLKDDIDDRKEKEKQLIYMATHDALTGLPNREFFYQSLNDAIEEKKAGEEIAVVFFDIDNFKPINEAFGQSGGDITLELIGNRLATLDAFLARIGGDEFAVFIRNAQRDDVVAELLSELQDVFSVPFKIQHSEVFLTISIGISLYPLDGAKAQNLLNLADSALKFSKNSGKNTYFYYIKEMDERALSDIKLKSYLRQAIKKDELEVYYQPQFDLKLNVVSGCEALVRWNHPNLGFLLPSQFIPQATATGMIQDISLWALKEAVTQMIDFRQQEDQLQRVAINISARNLRDSSLLKAVEQTIDETGIDPQYLEIEISEEIIYNVFDEALPLLRDLKNTGIRIALDDFGSGHSTLIQLTRFPFDTIKLDRSLVLGILDSKERRAIVRGAISMANGMGIELIAEGIEQKAELDVYAELGCEKFQGFYFSKALSAPVFKAYLIQNNNPEVGN